MNYKKHIVLAVAILAIGTIANAQSSSGQVNLSTNWLDSVGQKISFGGVFTVAKQQSPAQGAAVEWAAFHPVVKDVQLNIGPSYVIGTTGSGSVNHYFEGACILKLADTPVVNQATVNIPFVRNAALFVGAGVRLNYNPNVCGSFGLTFSF